MTTDDILDQLLYVLVQAYNQAALVGAALPHRNAGSDDDTGADRVDARGRLPQNDTHVGDVESEVQDGATSQDDAASFPVAAVLKYIADYHFINSNTTALGFTIANFQVATEYFLLRASHIASCRTCLALTGGVDPASGSGVTAGTASDGGRAGLATGGAPAEGVRCDQGIPLSKCELAHARIQRDLKRHLSEWERQQSATGVDERDVVGNSDGASSSEQHISDDDALERLFIVGEWSASEDTDDDQETEAEYANGAHVTRVHATSIASSSPPGKFVCVSAGQRFFAAVSDQGQLFTWGDRSGGRLGYAAAAGDTRRVHTPRVVQALMKHHIVSVACGAFHTLATNVNGHVFAWGSNTRGQLGFITHASADSPTVVAPTLVADLRGTYVSAVACGEYHSLALSSAGRVFSWGCNRYSKLGRPADTFADAVVRVRLRLGCNTGDQGAHSLIPTPCRVLLSNQRC